MARNANYKTGLDVFERWRDDLLSGTPPTLWPAGTGALARIELGPGLVMLLGGAPGAGKTAFTMQLVTDALRMTPTLRALIANVEVSPLVLLDRQLSRLSGVDLSLIRHRKLRTEHGERIDQALGTLETLADRFAFLRPPFDLANVAASADAFHADLILLDYIQRILPPGRHADKRSAVNATMDYLRQFADAGVGVIVIAAVGRTKDEKGRSSYSGAGLNLASFRESSELEFGCDDAFILVPSDKEENIVEVKHLKSRHGMPADLTLAFDRATQRFSDPDTARAWSPDSTPPGKLAAALQELWERTAPAADDQGDQDQNQED